MLGGWPLFPLDAGVYLAESGECEAEKACETCREDVLYYDFGCGCSHAANALCEGSYWEVTYLPGRSSTHQPNRRNLKEPGTRCNKRQRERRLPGSLC